MNKNTKKKKKNVHVDRKFLRDLADSIYNPRTRHFMRLCRGTLQNGPDPVDGDRTMHCGLGELYFAVTGLQPKQGNATERSVVNAVVERTVFAGHRMQVEKGFDRVIACIERSTILPNEQKRSLIKDVRMNKLGFTDPAEDSFRKNLEQIPMINDDCGEQYRDGVCDAGTYRDRARLVAHKLREAARLLPD
jgi:hypothetical protein